VQVEVVITRDAEDGAPFARALGDRVHVVFMPVTARVPATPEELAPLRAAVATHLDYVFVASRHAVPPLVAALAAAGLAPASAPPVTAVGPATTAALQAAGFTAQAGGATGEEAAATLAATDLHGRRVLVPRAAAGRDEPLALLRAAGAEVIDAVAYRTVAVAADAPEVAAGRAALVDGGAVCMLFAPSQVAALDAILARSGGLGVLARSRVLAIGSTTAAALVARGVAVAAVADVPTPAGMAKALASVYPEAT
jgi:uroporphyrinogen-III synthase